MSILGAITTLFTAAVVIAVAVYVAMRGVALSADPQDLSSWFDARDEGLLVDGSPTADRDPAR
jgi:hypothetical protein